MIVALLALTMLAVLAPPAAAIEPAVPIRLAGVDRVATAIALSQHGWEAAAAVVLVRADDPADAVASGPLADLLEAPLLLTSGTRLSPGVAEEIARLGATRVVIVGGTAAVGQSVAAALAADGRSVERIAGAERFATAVAVSRAIAEEPDGYLVALGAHPDPRRAWPDAVAAGAATILEGVSPILLTAHDRLPAVTRERLLEADAFVSLVGGTAAIPQEISDELEGTLFAVGRVAGADRYGTSRAVVDIILDGVSEHPAPLVIASGDNYPDALAAAALVARIDGLLVLVPSSGMDPDGEHVAWLQRKRRRFSSLVAVGGPAALSDAVVGQVAAAIARPTLPPVDGQLVLPPIGDLGPDWQEAFVIGYGDDPALLGTETLGDGLVVGPDFGAEAPDGTWWILDGRKRRFAHYDATGGYLGEVPVGPEFLASGGEFQYQGPRVLADGTLIATAQLIDDNSTAVLRLRDRKLDMVVADGLVSPRADDGERLYATDADGHFVSLDPATASIAPVDAFVGPDQAPWWVLLEGGALGFARPAEGQTRTLALRAAEPPGGEIAASLQAEVGQDGAIHVVIGGVAEADGTGIGGFITILPDGTITPVEPIRPLESTVETGGVSHLGIRPGTSEVTLMFVDADGVRVFRRQP